MKIIDVNAAFGFWPIQRFSTHTLTELDSVFDQSDVAEVWLSAIEGILFPEPDSWDVLLFGQLKDFPRFRPVKTVNPLLANWKKSWNAAVEQFPLAAVKLFPNYHGYSLMDGLMDAICGKAAAEKTIVLIQMRVNDERNQPHFLQVAGTPAADVAKLSLRYPEIRFIALCPYGGELPTLAKGSANLMADISFLDGADPLRLAGMGFPVDRLVFGSHEAFLHALAAKRKLDFSSLPPEVVQGVAAENLTRKMEIKS